MIRFTVHGKPEPAGSKKAYPFRRSNNSLGASVVDANKSAKPWQAIVASEAREAHEGELLTGPLSVTLTFYMVRPKSHYRTGKNSHLLKDSAPPFPTTRPDVLKLARAVEDALTKVVWHDDSQIVDEHLAKHYGNTQGVEVIVESLESHA